MDKDERPGGVDRFLRIFADVRAGEGVTALLLALNVFLILEAYYVLKPVRESLVPGSEGRHRYLALYLIHLLQRPGLFPDTRSRIVRESRREFRRLLPEQHRAEHAVPSVHTRAEVQRQTGDRLLLCPARRCVFRHPGLRWDHLADSGTARFYDREHLPGCFLDRARCCDRTAV